MDNREILTRYKAGTLDRRHAIALLRGALREAPRTRPEPQTRQERAVEAVRPAGPVRLPVPRGRSGDEPAVAQDGYAVIGLAGRYPQAQDLDAFWLGVLQARDTSCVPPERRATADGDGRGHFLEDADAFDPEFFGLTGEQAALMDPQERLFLEVAWETLERAGYTGVRLETLTAADGEPRSVGVYAAISSADYAVLAADGGAGQLTGGHWRLPNRLSALLDLRGPSHTVDTAESSFLAAVHQALAALRSGECAAALVGAVDLRLHPARQAPGGGEAVGAMLLKPLGAARADGDTVHAVIRSSAVVHQGLGDISTAEDRLARTARATTGIDLAEITLWETPHSVSRCVGDAGAATGVAALTRTVLQLRHHTLAPEQPGARPVPWTPRDANGAPLPRRASVTVHGRGGVCGQVVVEDYEERDFPEFEERGPRRRPLGGAEELVLLSAPTPQHLVATARRLALWAGALHEARRERPTLAEVAAELRAGRRAQDCRLAVTVQDAAQLAAVLKEFARQAGEGPTGVRGVDLRTRTAEVPLVDELPETRDYLSALWRARRHEQLTRLWLAGVDITAVARPPGRVVALPSTALIRRPLWYGDTPERVR
ncbi:polyketide synthase [Streptomyces sp. NPDC006739]|uniref:beta-ketoacyl [acyl carrier protein] synthase domain-containing protein n=1 Tax=Streptomyces sp. NPDC006739 TaxID=3364763 RepID=UPI0036A43BFE